MLEALSSSIASDSASDGLPPPSRESSLFNGDPRSPRLDALRSAFAPRFFFRVPPPLSFNMSPSLPPGRVFPLAAFSSSSSPSPSDPLLRRFFIFFVFFLSLCSPFSSFFRVSLPSRAVPSVPSVDTANPPSWLSPDPAPGFGSRVADDRTSAPPERDELCEPECVLASSTLRERSGRCELLLAPDPAATTSTFEFVPPCPPPFAWSAAASESDLLSVPAAEFRYERSLLDFIFVRFISFVE
mmetsp:Transcript_13887/g.34290  ORF Transcript_13887/g.34290 Transcript_13887/m.34290 type:complete len:242 (-) Transcript_13887:1656-2381(-)